VHTAPLPGFPYPQTPRIDPYTNPYVTPAKREPDDINVKHKAEHSKAHKRRKSSLMASIEASRSTPRTSSSTLHADNTPIFTQFIPSLSVTIQIPEGQLDNKGPETASVASHLDNTEPEVTDVQPDISIKSEHSYNAQSYLLNTIAQYEATAQAAAIAQYEAIAQAIQQQPTAPSENVAVQTAQPATAEI
jgi:hypothetical protein